MKHLFFLIVFAGLFTGQTFAGETTTDCPMMKEANDRVNTKSSLSSQPRTKRPVKSSVVSG
jgi:hypothetical protein